VVAKAVSIVTVLRAEIIGGTIPAGTRLNTRTFAEGSLTPVR
jgi:DNA-binding GntR family transcriptional regulator